MKKKKKRKEKSKENSKYDLSRMDCIPNDKLHELNICNKQNGLLFFFFLEKAFPLQTFWLDTLLTWITKITNSTFLTQFSFRIALSKKIYTIAYCTLHTSEWQSMLWMWCWKSFGCIYQNYILFSKHLNTDFHLNYSYYVWPNDSVAGVVQTISTKHSKWKLRRMFKLFLIVPPWVASSRLSHPTKKGVILGQVW